MANYHWPDRKAVGASRLKRVPRKSVSDGPVSGASTLFRINGAELVPHFSGALFWPSRETLIVADLHLEKGSAYAPTGQLLPPYDTRATLQALGKAIDAFAVRRVICLGDSFHDVSAPDRLSHDDRELLKRLVGGVDWIWIAGNHDPEPPKDVGGTSIEELTDGPLVFRHEAAALPNAGELSGHFHPKAWVRTRARRVSGRCFVEDGKRAILPSFGAYTGGLDVLDPAIARHFPKGFHIHLVAADRVYRFPRKALL